MSNPDTPGMALASSLQQVVGALIFGSERPLSIEDIRTCLQEVGALDEQTRVFADAAPREVRDAAKLYGVEPLITDDYLEVEARVAERLAMIGRRAGASA